ncbi:hypothetical protein BDZ97DRAFT_1903351 [Flammula alnicola]|nr:hypothetical protein BDZ97DRAFT_1903351 [Flammula alnicola]
MPSGAAQKVRPGSSVVYKPRRKLELCPYTLIQWGDDPLRHHYVDNEGRPAFTINPNPVIRVTREAAWSQQHPSIMGPDNSYLYLGPESTPGYVVYGGNTTHISMTFFLRPGKREGSLSRYFRCQNGKDYKWRLCVDDQEHYARLIIKQSAMSLITEIVTSLILNRMAIALGW